MSRPRVTVTLGRGQVARKELSKPPPVANNALKAAAPMYADIEEKKGKSGDLRSRLGVRSNGIAKGVKARLSGGTLGAGGGERRVMGKRQSGEDDDKWQHDMYETADGAEAGDLRTRLSRRVIRGPAGAKDLRDRLSGPAERLQVSIGGGPQAKQRRLASAIASTALLEEAGARRPVAGASTGVAGLPSSSARVGPGAGKNQTIASFLTPLGLAKYIANFQAEEVDMAALRHLKEDDLKEMGIPMGPRKKIILALNPQS